jgi:hypothetical protein
MTTFTIDSENNLIAHAGTPANADHAQTFSTEKEFARLTADWPGSRLVEVWNRLAGAMPFELKPVKKFMNRPTAVRRLWEAVVRLRAIVASEPGAAKQRLSKPKSRGTARNGASSKKAQVIAMMRRPKGATLAAIMGATGCQKHTVRGFVSLLSSRSGTKVESSQNSAGERSYRMAK